MMERRLLISALLVVWMNGVFSAPKPLTALNFTENLDRSEVTMTSKLEGSNESTLDEEYLETTTDDVTDETVLLADESTVPAINLTTLSLVTSGGVTSEDHPIRGDDIRDIASKPAEKNDPSAMFLDSRHEIDSTYLSKVADTNSALRDNINTKRDEIKRENFANDDARNETDYEKDLDGFHDSSVKLSGDGYATRETQSDKVTTDAGNEREDELKEDENRKNETLSSKSSLSTSPNNESEIQGNVNININNSSPQDSSNMNDDNQNGPNKNNKFNGILEETLNRPEVYINDNAKIEGDRVMIENKYSNNATKTIDDGYVTGSTDEASLDFPSAHRGDDNDNNSSPMSNQDFDGEIKEHDINSSFISGSDTVTFKIEKPSGDSENEREQNLPITTEEKSKEVVSTSIWTDNLSTDEENITIKLGFTNFPTDSSSSNPQQDIDNIPETSKLAANTEDGGIYSKYVGKETSPSISDTKSGEDTYLNLSTTVQTGSTKTPFQTTLRLSTTSERDEQIEDKTQFKELTSSSADVTTINLNNEDRDIFDADDHSGQKSTSSDLISNHTENISFTSGDSMSEIAVTSTMDETSSSKSEIHSNDEKDFLFKAAKIPPVTSSPFQSEISTSFSTEESSTVLHDIGNTTGKILGQHETAIHQNTTEEVSTTPKSEHAITDSTAPFEEFTAMTQSAVSDIHIQGTTEEGPNRTSPDNALNDSQRETFHDRYVSGNNTDMIAAVQFLHYHDKASSEQCFKLVDAHWNYATNLTEENKKKQLFQTLEYSLFHKEAWRNATSFAWKSFNDTLLRRWFKSLSVLGTASLPEEQLNEFNRLKAEMKNTYSTAKVCSYISPQMLKSGSSLEHKKCDLTLEPDLQRILTKSRDYDELVHVWKAWRDAAGKPIREKFLRFVNLSNEAARLNGFKDTGDMWQESYESESFKEDLDHLWEQLRPLYEHLHAYVRRKLIGQYGAHRIREDGPIPAHLFGNMWAQSWVSLLDIAQPYSGKPSVDVTSVMDARNMTALEMFEVSEEFFTSLGLKKMPAEFWKHSLIEKPKDREIICHASAWDFCNGRDYRIKQCTDITMEDLITVHHEMGHIQYFLQYARQPNVFREGANPGFHEAIGDVLALSVSTPKHLQSIGLLEEVADDPEGDLNFLLRTALEKVSFLPSGYLIDLWRWGLFSGEIQPQEMNSKWWELRLKYQGICPPLKRTDTDFDPGAKYHIPGNVPYIRYFVSFVIQFQFHKVLCDAAGHTGPLYKCDIYRSKDAGQILSQVMELGSSEHWSEAMKIMTGGATNKMDAQPIMEYFEPLLIYLKEQNQNETLGWRSSDASVCP